MRTTLILAAILLAAGCAGRRDLRLTSEPSIERAFDILNRTREGRGLIKFLAKNPVRFEYSNTAGLCHKLDLKRRVVYLPLDYKGSDLVMALAVARAGYIYRLYTQTGLEELISEEEELSALFQARLAVELSATEDDFPKDGAANAIRINVCTYLLENSAYAMSQARREALGQNQDCGRPLETLENQRVWLEKTRKAINDESFYQLLYERDLARVRKGAITQADAMKNDAAVRALPTYEVYRFQRTFYDRQSDIFSSFQKVYDREVKADAAWRLARQQQIDEERAEFSACNLIK